MKKNDVHKKYDFFIKDKIMKILNVLDITTELPKKDGHFALEFMATITLNTTLSYLKYYSAQTGKNLDAVAKKFNKSIADGVKKILSEVKHKKKILNKKVVRRGKKK